MSNKRKIAQIWGFSIFKSCLRFVLITAMFLNLEGNLLALGVIILISVDLAVQANLIATEAFAIDQKDKAWMDLLANRFFVKDLIERIRNKEHIDVDDMYRNASTASVADINLAAEEEKSMISMSGVSLVASGVWAFISNAIGYASAYGVPYLLAQFLRAH